MTPVELRAAIVQRAGCDVLDGTVSTLDEQRLSVERRLQRMLRTPSDSVMVANSIDKLWRTLTAIREMQQEAQA